MSEAVRIEALMPRADLSMPRRWRGRRHVLAPLTRRPEEDVRRQWRGRSSSYSGCAGHSGVQIGVNLCSRHFILLTVDWVLGRVCGSVLSVCCSWVHR